MSPKGFPKPGGFIPFDEGGLKQIEYARSHANADVLDEEYLSFLATLERQGGGTPRQLDALDRLTRDLRLYDEHLNRRLHQLYTWDNGYYDD